MLVFIAYCWRLVGIYLFVDDVVLLVIFFYLVFFSVCCVFIIFFFLIVVFTIFVAIFIIFTSTRTPALPCFGVLSLFTLTYQMYKRKITIVEEANKIVFKMHFWNPRGVMSNSFPSIDLLNSSLFMISGFLVLVFNSLSLSESFSILFVSTP